MRDYPIEIQRRPYQRSVGVIVNPNGVVKVTAGITTPRFYIQSVLKEHQDWIDKTLNKYREIQKKFPPKKYKPGENFLFKGELKTLKLKDSQKKRSLVLIEDESLVLYSSQVLESSEIKKQLLKFYKAQGVLWLTQMIEEESQKMGLYPQKLSFRSQKSRWGSCCKSSGSISLNWKLIGAPEAVARYVVIHELAHLKHANHSKSFWNLVDQHCDDLKAQKKWFKEESYSLDFLSKKSEIHREDGSCSENL